MAFLAVLGLYSTSFGGDLKDPGGGTGGPGGPDPKIPPGESVIPATDVGVDPFSLVDLVTDIFGGFLVVALAVGIAYYCIFWGARCLRFFFTGRGWS